MERRRTVGQYRGIDLFIFALLVVAGEWVVTNAARFWFPDQLYALSVTPLLTAIVMMRWGPWAAIHAALGGREHISTASVGSEPRRRVIVTYVK